MTTMAHWIRLVRSPKAQILVPSALQTPITATSPQHSTYQTSEQHSVPHKDLSTVTACPAGCRTPTAGVWLLRRVC